MCHSKEVVVPMDVAAFFLLRTSNTFFFQLITKVTHSVMINILSSLIEGVFRKQQKGGRGRRGPPFVLSCRVPRTRAPVYNSCHTTPWCWCMMLSLIVSSFSPIVSLCCGTLLMLCGLRSRRRETREEKMGLSYASICSCALVCHS